MKVKKVIIEGFHNIFRKEYDLSENIVYLHGRNGSGKSTVLQAIQLGLLGYVPGTNKTKQGVFSHANSRSMSIKVILDNDGEKIIIERIWTMVKTSVSEELKITPEGYDIKTLVADIELPLFNFDEFSHMTANTLKDWFINFLPKAEFKTDWRTELKASLSDLPNTIIDQTLIDDSVAAIVDLHQEGVDEIRSANAYFKNQTAFMKQELTRKTSTIQSLIHYDDYVASHSEDDLKDLIRSTESKIVQASIIRQNFDRVQRIKHEMSGLQNAENNVAVCESKMSDAVTEYDEVYKKLEEKENEYLKLCNEVSSYQKIIDSKGLCPYTQTGCNSIAALRDSYVERTKELNIRISELLNELTEIKKRKSVLDGQVSNFRGQILALQNDVRRYNQLKKELENLPVSETNFNVEDLQVDLEKYKEEYGKAVANRQYNELSSVVLQDKYRIENALECLKIWVKLTDVNGLQARGGDENPFNDLKVHVDSVLKDLFGSSDVECKFITEGKANSFSFGIDRNDVYVPYTLLSSGEKCLFILSMYIGLLNYTKSSLKLVLIDDFFDHLDDENFKSVFQTLKDKTDIQYIFAGVKPVEDTVCKVIHVS